VFHRLAGIATKIFFAVAGLVVVLALVSRGGALSSDADAQVDIQLAGNADVNATRERLVTEAGASWQATRVAETSDSDDETSVEFALPGSSLDGFIAALRRQPDAESVEVDLEVAPEQVQPESLASGDSDGEAAAPVRVQVNLTRDAGQGPLVTFLGALLVALLAAAALAMVWRRFGTEPEPPAAEDPPRKWTNRP